MQLEVIMDSMLVGSPFENHWNFDFQISWICLLIYCFRKNDFVVKNHGVITIAEVSSGGDRS